MKNFRSSLTQPVGVPLAIGLTVLVATAEARPGNYNPNAAGNASGQGLANANCNSALILEPCEEVSAEIIAEAAAQASMPAQPVPEPGSFALMFVAVAMVLLAKRWRPKPGIQGA